MIRPQYLYRCQLALLPRDTNGSNFAIIVMVGDMLGLLRFIIVLKLTILNLAFFFFLHRVCLERRECLRSDLFITAASPGFSKYGMQFNRRSAKESVVASSWNLM